jgi:SET domain-containing protein
MRTGLESSRSLYLDNLLFANKLIIKRSEIHRWGVFAREPIKKYEIIEEFPYFKVPMDEITNTQICLDYSYKFDDDYHVIGMGFCGMYNHSFNPNVEYEIDKVNEVMRHYAIHDINIDNELTLNYGEENVSHFENLR